MVSAKKRGFIKKSFMCEFHGETVSNVNLGLWNIIIHSFPAS